MLKQSIKLEIDPKEWRTVIDLALSAKPKGEDQKVVHDTLAKNKEVIVSATGISIKEPF